MLRCYCRQARLYDLISVFMTKIFMRTTFQFKNLQPRRLKLQLKPLDLLQVQNWQNCRPFKRYLHWRQKERELAQNFVVKTRNWMKNLWKCAIIIVSQSYLCRVTQGGQSTQLSLSTLSGFACSFVVNFANVDVPFGKYTHCRSLFRGKFRQRKLAKTRKL